MESEQKGYTGWCKHCIVRMQQKTGFAPLQMEESMGKLHWRLCIVSLEKGKEEGKDQESIQSNTTPDGKMRKTQENVTYKALYTFC